MGSREPRSDPEPAGVANDFLAAYLADLRAGRSRTLVDYQAQFPGHEAAVAAEWEAMHDAAPQAWPEIPQVRIEGLIGQGGQGTVYRGRQTYIDRPVAVKVLASPMGLPLFAGRFEREARSLAGLTHPHIVACYQAGVTDAGLCYLVMELVDGPTLRSWLDDHGPMPVAVALRLVRDLALALQHAFERGIIHRDVKPENVLLKPDPAAPDAAFPWRAMLADLGLARPLEIDPRLSMATPAGAVLGTPETMAPEQVDAPAQVDHRADFYGLGCVLYHAVTGRPAFRRGTMTELMAAKTAASGPDPRLAGARVPAEVAALVMRLCARAPSDRPATHAELIGRIEGLLGQTERRRGIARRAAPWLAAAAIVGLGWYAWPDSRDRSAAAGDRPAPGAAPLAPGERLALFAEGDEPVRDWRQHGGRWAFDDRSPTGGASLNSSRGAAAAVRALPGGAFELRGSIDPRESPGEPQGRTRRAGLRCEMGDTAMEVDLVPDGGGYRATARRVTRDGAAGTWRETATLGTCKGAWSLAAPMSVRLRWSDGALVCWFGAGEGGEPVEVTLRPPDPGAALALALFVERGTVSFRDFDLRGL
jgi:hypothetical protein